MWLSDYAGEVNRRLGIWERVCGECNVFHRITTHHSVTAQNFLHKQPLFLGPIHKPCTPRNSTLQTPWAASTREPMRASRTIFILLRPISSLEGSGVYEQQLKNMAFAMRPCAIGSGVQKLVLWLERTNSIFQRLRRNEVMNDKGDCEGGVFRCSGFSLFLFYRRRVCIFLILGDLGVRTLSKNIEEITLLK